MNPIATLLPIWAQILIALVPAFAAALAAFGLFLNVKQSRRTNAQGRAAIVAKSLERFTDDEDMQEIFYKIEYSEFSYKQDEFHESPEEKQLDKLLMHWSIVALAWESGLLKTDDLRPLQYLVRRILGDKGVQEYLQFVASWSSNANLGSHPYIALAKMGKVLEPRRLPLQSP
jgi:hypothetical protein